MFSYEIPMYFLRFTAHQRIRNRFLQVVRSTLLHLSSLAGPTGNFGDFEISCDLGMVFSNSEESKHCCRDVSDLGMVVHILIDLLIGFFHRSFWKSTRNKIETCLPHGSEN